LYLKTYKNIETELSLPVHQRESADTLLKELRHTMTRISEIAPPIPSNIIDKYNRVFKGSNVSAPVIANGIESIQICKMGPALVPSLVPIVSPEEPVPVVPKPLSRQWPSAIPSSRRQINIITT
jgi:hypothetical protein